MWPHHWYKLYHKTRCVINILCRVRPGAEAAFGAQWDYAGYRCWWLRSAGSADGSALQRIPRRHLEYVSPVLRLLSHYCEHISAKFQRTTTTEQEWAMGHVSHRSIVQWVMGHMVMGQLLSGLWAIWVIVSCSVGHGPHGSWVSCSVGYGPHGSWVSCLAGHGPCWSWVSCSMDHKGRTGFG